MFVSFLLTCRSLYTYYIFWIQALCHKNIFLFSEPVDFLCIFIMVPFKGQKFRVLIKSNLSSFTFIINVFVSCPRNLCFIQGHKDFLPCLIYIYFFGLAFTFRSTTHVKFIFLYGLNKRCEFPLAAITKFQKHLSG